MDFDLTWLLWGLPIAFGLGWFASRLDLRQLRISTDLQQLGRMQESRLTLVKNLALNLQWRARPN